MKYATNAVSDTYLDDTASEAAIAPKTLIDASLGKLEKSNRPKGLILTKQEIIDLYRYEKKSLNLPTTPEDVIVYLGYDQKTSPGRGLDISDFAKTFSTVKTHASQWDGLRQRIKLISAELKVFAKHITSTEKAVTRQLDNITALDIMDQFEIVTLEDLKRVELEKGDAFPGITLNGTDQKAVQRIGYFLDRVLLRIQKQEADTALLKKDLDTFAIELASIVRPEIALRLVAIDNNNFKRDVVNLQRQIEDLNKEIDQQTASYNKMVRESLTAASSLNVVGLGMAIYFGVEAENIRKARNALKAKRDQKNAEMGTKSKVLERLNTVKADMQDLEFLTVQADAATQNLVTVWNKLHLYVKASKEESDEINNALDVSFLAYHFEQVAGPWALILNEADALHEVFAEAEDEIKKYGY